MVAWKGKPEASIAKETRPLQPRVRRDLYIYVYGLRGHGTCLLTSVSGYRETKSTVGKQLWARGAWLPENFGGGIKGRCGYSIPPQQRNPPRKQGRRVLSKGNSNLLKGLFQNMLLRLQRHEWSKLPALKIPRASGQSHMCLPCRSSHVTHGIGTRPPDLGSTLSPTSAPARPREGNPT